MADAATRATQPFQALESDWAEVPTQKKNVRFRHAVPHEHWSTATREVSFSFRSPMKAGEYQMFELQGFSMI